jgi:hypothetical protein
MNMRKLKYNATYASVDITLLAAERASLFKQLASEVFSLIEMGCLRLISTHTVFPISLIENAFASLQDRDTYGKIVVNQGAEDLVKVANKLVFC